MKMDLSEEAIQSPSTSVIANSLKKRERMAVQCYQRAHTKLSKYWPVDELLDLKFRHQMSGMGLDQLIEDGGEKSGSSSKAWRTVGDHIKSSRGMSRLPKIISSFLEAEKRLSRSYRQILSDTPPDDDFHSLVDHNLLPRTLENIDELCQLAARIKDSSDTCLRVAI